MSRGTGTGVIPTAAMEVSRRTSPTTPALLSGSMETGEAAKRLRQSKEKRRKGMAYTAMANADGRVVRGSATVTWPGGPTSIESMGSTTKALPRLGFRCKLCLN